MTIYAKDYIKTGFSIEDANKLESIIKKELYVSDKITIDFSNITMFTTLFFNNALSKYVIRLGPEKYQRKFEIANLSETGQAAYKYSFENALNCYGTFRRLE